MFLKPETQNIKKQLIGTLSINMHTPEGRAAQSEYQTKLAKNVAQKYHNKMAPCKIYQNEFAIKAKRVDSL